MDQAPLRPATPPRSPLQLGGRHGGTRRRACRGGAGEDGRWGGCPWQRASGAGVRDGTGRGLATVAALRACGLVQSQALISGKNQTCIHGSVYSEAASYFLLLLLLLNQHVYASFQQPGEELNYQTSSSSLEWHIILKPLCPVESMLNSPVMTSPEENGGP